MLADAPGFLVDFAAVAGAFVTIIGACVLISHLRPVRWVWRRLVSEPFGAWVRDLAAHAVAPVLDELKPNCGESFRDLVLARIDRNEGRLGVLEDRTRAIAEQLGAAPPPGTP